MKESARKSFTHFVNFQFPFFAQVLNRFLHLVFASRTPFLPLYSVRLHSKESADSIRSVHIERTMFLEHPSRFETKSVDLVD